VDVADQVCIFGGMIRTCVSCLVLAILLPSCGSVRTGMSKLSNHVEEPVPSPFGPTGVPAHLRKQPEGTAIPGGGNVQVKFGDITPVSELVFTDADNPDASLIELSSILVAPSSGSWETDIRAARRRSLSEGKPLLLWFTDSTSSPLCRTLNRELFNTPEFVNWASPRLVLLKVDGVHRERVEEGTIGDADEYNINRRHTVAELKKRYKILGYPSLVMLKPDGEVVGRYRGFKRGQGDYFWGLIKHGEAVAATAYASWRADMEKKGYRTWSDGRGRNVFAKLQHYSNGQLVLIEPDGTRSRTRESSLSASDQKWISEQKALRGIQ
jgi:thioredoxin-related protein